MREVPLYRTVDRIFPQGIWTPLLSEGGVRLTATTRIWWWLLDATGTNRFVSCMPLDQAPIGSGASVVGKKWLSTINMVSLRITQLDE